MGGPFGPVPIGSGTVRDGLTSHDAVAGTWAVGGTLIPSDPNLTPDYFQKFVAIVATADPDTLIGQFDFTTTAAGAYRGSFLLRRVKS